MLSIWSMPAIVDEYRRPLSRDCTRVTLTRARAVALTTNRFTATVNSPTSVSIRL